MAFDSLSEKLQNVFKNLRSKGKLTEDDVKAALKEVKMALLEADVNFKVVKQFTKSVQEIQSGAATMCMMMLLLMTMLWKVILKAVRRITVDTLTRKQ